jgi:hypothetical protein
VAELQRRMPLAIRFRQITSVTRAAFDASHLLLGGYAVTGSEPAVLAFVLGHTGDTVVFEILNRPAPVTWHVCRRGDEYQRAVGILGSTFHNLDCAWSLIVGSGNWSAPGVP